MTNKESRPLVRAEAMPSVRLRRCQVSDLGIVKCPISASSKSDLDKNDSKAYCGRGVGRSEPGSGSRRRNIQSVWKTLDRRSRHSAQSPAFIGRTLQGGPESLQKTGKALASFRALRVNGLFYGKTFTPFSGTRNRTCTASTLSCRNTPSEAGARPANRLRWKQAIPPLPTTG